jgi:hypothetical protein
MRSRRKEAAMALRHRIQYLRKEHEELLHLADRIEKMLESASKNDFAEHLKSLTGLRSLEHGLAGIVEHCHAEDRIIESTYHHYLQQDERARIDAEHEQIIRAVTNFREELKCATTDQTMAMILPGMDVVRRLRAHIAYEGELLGRIAELGNPPKTAVGKKKTGKRAHEKKRRHVTRRKTGTKSANVLPYTLEPHPEL